MNGFEDVEEWVEEWEISDTQLEEEHKKVGLTYLLELMLGTNRENLVSSWILGKFLKSS